MPLLTTVATLPLYALWWGVFATGGGDLAAQIAWAGFAERFPDSAYNLFWHGGLHAANYSVISPYLMALFGVLPVTLASGIAATWLAALICRHSGVRRPLWPALMFGVTLWCQVVSGRTTFVLGVAFGMAAVLCVVGGGGGRRLVPGALCAALATLASPVAGLFLLVAGAAYLLLRRGREALVLAAPPVAVVLTTTLLFPFEGEQPMPFVRVLAPVAICLAVILAAPRSWRLVRLGAGVFAVGVLLTFLIPSPIGTNVERLTEFAGPPVLLAAALNLGAQRTRVEGTEVEASRGVGGLTSIAVRRIALVCAAVLALGWLAGRTASDVIAYTEVPAWAIETDGVVDALERLDADRTRVEVVPARDHREAAVLAPHINMARGWNRQADVTRGRLFYDGRAGTAVPAGTFTADSYRAWLDRWAVGLVVLYDGRPDGPAELEHALVTSEPSYLERVWSDDNWRIYRVKDAVPLAEQPASVVGSDGADLTLDLPEAGSVGVRIAYSPWLWASSGCLRQDGEFTRLTVEKPGRVRISSRFGGPPETRTPAPRCAGGSG
ncbi:hypothetical protein GUY60_33835 [Streptomyces sp. YC537]|uniref:Uncharacterized protein n=1 Tax=Streptomyces boluensis TaxID=1775135 RepID=A0A964UVR8_9ACTN|nr:hypothetical protein [Streptomyces boluensis]